MSAQGARARGAHVDASGLECELRARLDGEVRFEPADRALYATDAGNYRHVPVGVVIPRSIADVERTMDTCRRFDAPLVSRGGGTSIGGQCVNTGVVLDFSKYLNRVLEVDPDRRLARVQPGVVRDRLVEAAAPHGLTFGPDTATHPWATMGGMIGNNSCGIHSVMVGRTADNVRELDVLTSDGRRMRVGAASEEELDTIIRAGGAKGETYRRLRELRDRYHERIRERYPLIPRRVSGYNLDELLPEHGFHVARALVGSEATCATILEATVELVEKPTGRALLVLAYEDVARAADHVPELLESGPIGLEGMDGNLVADLRRHGEHPRKLELLPEGGSWLLVEFGGGTPEEARDRARAVEAAVGGSRGVVSTALLDDPSDQDDVWTLRESGLGATAFVPHRDDTWEGWEDAAVPPERLGEYLRDFRALLDRYGYYGALYGHFGDGCVHTRITFDLVTAGGVRSFRSFVDEAADLVVGYGGSLSGEHGDGQARSELLEKMFGEELLGAFREFKAIWDPDGRMNPGRIVDPDPIAADLRLGTDYNPPRPETHFAFPDDQGDFSRAALRCVGVGKCRKTESGTMCPSYMVLGEEMHTTRGRAHLLYEMLQGDPVRNGWRDEKVKESLDLCLSCKGCTSECPVHVDIPTYRAEFLAHYFEGRIRPRSAYAFGLIHWWARLASVAPGAANFFAHAPGFREAAKWMAGVAPERTLPRFAPRTFRRWWKDRGGGLAGNGRAPRADGRTVILWADTFTNAFEPEVPQAAVEVLEHAGYDVVVPEASLCCGRPLYEFGFLDLARRQLRRTLEELRPEIRAGIPVVGVEPSCTAVFRDELRAMLPQDDDAGRLRGQVHTLYEFLDRRGYTPPSLQRRALVHGHCHQKALLDPEREHRLLERMGLEIEALDSGCCGMAGSFGYERGDRYAVSVGAGERVLLPAVREAEADTLVLTNGFSCRQQIEQGTDRRAQHFAQVVQTAIRDAEERSRAPAPLSRAEALSAPTTPDPTPSRDGRAPGRILAASAGIAVGGALAAYLGRRISR